MPSFPDGYDAFDTPADTDVLGGSRPGATGVKQRKLTLAALWAFLRAKLTTTPVTVAEGGTGAATAAAARTALGLGNVDNTSDASKPVSTAQAAAIALKLNASEKGASGGVAELDGVGRVIRRQIPPALSGAALLTSDAATADRALVIDADSRIVSGSGLTLARLYIDVPAAPPAASVYLLSISNSATAGSSTTNALLLYYNAAGNLVLRQFGASVTAYRELTYSGFITNYGGCQRLRIDLALSVNATTEPDLWIEGVEQVGSFLFQAPVPAWLDASLTNTSKVVFHRNAAAGVVAPGVLFGSRWTQADVTNDIAGTLPPSGSPPVLLPVLDSGTTVSDAGVYGYVGYIKAGLSPIPAFSQGAAYKYPFQISGLVHILMHGQSNATGASSSSVWDGDSWINDGSDYTRLTPWQPFSNITFAPSFTASAPLTGSNVAMHYGGNSGEGETPLPTLANQLASELDIQCIASSCGVGGAPIAFLGKPVSFATKALMDADLAHPKHQVAQVTSDPTPANNRYYRKTDEEGLGEWSTTMSLITGTDIPWYYLGRHLFRGHQRADDLTKDYFVAAIPYIQGEADAKYVDPDHSDFKSEWYYRGRLIQLHTDLVELVRTNTGQRTPPLMVIDQILFAGDDRASSEAYFGLAKNQLAAADATPGLVISHPRYALTSAIHYTAELQRWAGAYMAKVIRHVCFEGGTWSPLRPTSWTLDSDKIRLRFHVPHGRLQFSTNSARGGNVDSLLTEFGFEFSDDDARTISSVEIVGRDEVLITLSGAAGANAVLSYARGQRYGNLCDTDTAEGYYVSATDDLPFDLRNWCVSFEVTLN